MEKQKYCVYNQNSECFLSLKVVAADTMFARLRGLIGKLKFRFDEGLWIVPSKGTHTIGALSPVDMIYLDAKQRVTHVVESLSTLRMGPLHSDTASVLALAPHSIYSSQTQVGDQMVICVAADMANSMESAVQSSARTPTTLTSTTVEASRVVREPAREKPKKPSNSWLKNLFSSSSDRRNATRHLSPQLIAFYWNGGAPVAHAFRDISRTGLFLLTDDNWYPGTIVRLTLQSAEDLGIHRMDPKTPSPYRPSCFAARRMASASRSSCWMKTRTYTETGSKKRLPGRPWTSS